MALVYDKFPPVADDVRMAATIDTGDRGTDLVMGFTVGEHDAHQLAVDITRDKDGLVDLAEVRRGLTLASSVMREEIQLAYLRGVEYYIQENLKRAKQGSKR